MSPVPTEEATIVLTRSEEDTTPQEEISTSDATISLERAVQKD